MFDLFKRNPNAKLQKEIDRLYEKGFQLQRSGKLVEYGRVLKKIEELEKQKKN
jgi:hypothetical protein